MEGPRTKPPCARAYSPPCWSRDRPTARERPRPGRLSELAEPSAGPACRAGAFGHARGMLALILSASLAAAPPQVEQHIADLCAEVSDETCIALYALADLLDLLMTGEVEPPETGSWCCRECVDGTGKGPLVTCSGCQATKRGIECGGAFRADRPARLDCPGATVEIGDTVKCY